MKFRILTLAMVFAISASFYSCTEGAEASSAVEETISDSQNTASEAGDEITEVSAEIKEESNKLFAEFKEARLDLTNRKKEIESNMRGKTDEVKAEMQKDWEKLGVNIKDLDIQMNGIRGNMGSGWKEYSEESRKVLERATKLD